MAYNMKVLVDQLPEHIILSPYRGLNQKFLYIVFNQFKALLYYRFYLTKPSTGNGRCPPRTGGICLLSILADRETTAAVPYDTAVHHDSDCSGNTSCGSQL